MFCLHFLKARLYHENYIISFLKEEKNECNLEMFRL